MNMFKPVKPTSVKEYLAAVPSERKEAIEFLHAFIQKSAPELGSHFASNMLGYGSFPYVNYKKETIQWPIVALANQKNYMSVYICALHPERKGKYIAEYLEPKLGKVSVGKSCIRFKKLEDLNLETLKEAIQLAAKNPGLR